MVNLVKHSGSRWTKVHPQVVQWQTSAASGVEKATSDRHIGQMIGVSTLGRTMG